MLMTPCKVLQMSNKSEISTLVPILDGLNYGTLHKSMKAYLMSLGLWGHVSGTIAMPTHPSNPAIDRHGNAVTASQSYIDAYTAAMETYSPLAHAWAKDNEKALGAILL